MRMLERRREPAAHHITQHVEDDDVGVDGFDVVAQVGQLLDIVEHPLTELEPGSRPGVAGTMVLDGRVTEVLDLPQILSDWDEDAIAALTGMELSA